jgi:hypothetical protein
MPATDHAADEHERRDPPRFAAQIRNSSHHRTHRMFALEPFALTAHAADTA